MIFPSADAALPRPADPERRRRGRERWMETAREVRGDDPSLADFMSDFAEDKAGGALLDAVFGASPFLTSCAVKEPGLVRAMSLDGPDTVFNGLLNDLADTLSPEESALKDVSAVMKELRVARRKAALLIALADIAGTWTLEQVTEALSAFADAALGHALAHVLTVSAGRGEFSLPHPDDPQKDSGVFILAMGKLGSRELNYSSDIDLIILFDSETIDYTGSSSLQTACVRMTRELVRVMEERTADGYVFRTDLRLRPDPGSTPPALSVLAAVTYYESMGQNWERAAMIKARCAAGDRKAGMRFLADLRPFVWRKSLDFWAIQDIQSIKRQINAQRGGNRMTIPGHNIKLGQGGIREIEFFAQTQQLIWGGREPDLRTPATCAALDALAAHGHVHPETAEEMKDHYRYLRALEHRLQMIDDQQTQELPKERESLTRVALFMGHDSLDAFSESLGARLKCVADHYARLFEDQPSLGDSGNLVFTGGEHDPDTLKTLAGMGFKGPEAISSTIRGWHHGRYGATRSTRARELLTELTPALLRALGETANPDKAFLRFDEFLRRMPARVQLFSLFHANPGLLGLVAEIMGDAPRLAEHLSRKPALLDSVLSPDFFDPLPPGESLREELDGHLAQARDFEDVLDLARRWTGDRKFQVGVQVLRTLMNAEDAGEALSDVAEATITCLLPYVEDDFARNHGRLHGASMAIIALGKLGAREMTPASDLDLVFVYDAPQGVEDSDGAKPLAPNVYFMRFGQRLINALTALTAEGRLYEVDMRLRPSGNAGPLAASLEAFVKYHEEAAWTWEHMALTRARVIAGPPELSRRLEDIIRAIIARPRDPARLAADIAEMRNRMAREHAAQSRWDIKHMRGGLVDVEFITQYLVLRHAFEHPEVLCPNTLGALERMKTLGLLEDACADTLMRAHFLWRTLQGVLRLTLRGRFDENMVSAGLQAKLARSVDARDFDDLKRRMDDCTEAVRDAFERHVERMAEDDAAS